MTEEQNNTPNIWNDFAARALRTGAAVPSIEMQFDAEMARLGLAWNYSGNRPRSRNNVSLLVKAASDGSFLHGTVLRIAYDNLLNQWVLVDGQHRLAAVEESGTKQWFIVAVDAMPADISYTIVDSIGKTRGAPDMIHGTLSWYPNKHTTAVISAARIVYCDFDVREAKERKTAAQVREIAKIVDCWKPAYTAICGIKLMRKIGRAQILAALLPAMQYHEEKILAFLKKAIEDKDIHMSSTEMRLYDLTRITSDSVESRIRLLHMSAHVVNAVITNSVLSKLPKFTGEFPGIAGTPYAK